jgi:uroporphyrinogen decarboxylase
LPEEDMTPRERWLAILKHKKPDRVPMDYRATSEVTKKIMEYLDCKAVKELFERLHIDRPIPVSPRYIGPPIPEDADLFGCRFRDIQYGSNETHGVYRECIYHPLAKYKTLDKIKRNYRWPDPDLYDYSQIPEKILNHDEYPIMVGGSEPFLRYKHLRGQEQAYKDLILHSEIVHFCLDRLFDLCYENTRRIYEPIPSKHSRVMLTSVAEDLGSQTGLLYSPAHIHKFLIPRMKRMMDLAHHYGGYVMTHSDGAIREIIPDLIEIGMDVLDPVQWRCRGMDREGLKRYFGDKIVFHGAMDNQYTLAFGLEEEIRQEVRVNIRVLGDEGGYILGPCHNIQVVSPMKNIIAMYDEGYKSGWY